MVAFEEFSRLVAAIYAAPVASQPWQDALRDIHRTLGGIVGGLLMTDGATWSLDNSTLPEGAAQSYAEHYYRLDRVLAAVERGPAGAVRTGSELMPLVRKSEFYEDWLRPLEIDDGLFVRLDSDPKPTCLIVAAPKRSEPFDTPDRVKLVSGLVPHLQQAMRMHKELKAFAQNTADLAAALEAVRHGIIIVGPNWRVINLNTSAERIVRAEDGFKMWSARLAAESATADHKLQRALHAAVTREGDTIRSGQSFICERPSGKQPYVVHVLPLHRGPNEMTREPRALVLIVDPDQEPEPAATLLRRLYGLTATEADVALRIARGADLKEVSSGLSVSITTVRKHLQHVFDKTGTHRQAELVRLLLTLRP